MTLLPPPAPVLPAPAPPAPPARSSSPLGWILAVLVAFGAFFGLSEWLRSSEVREAEVKAWLTTMALGLAAVQVATMAVVYRGRRGRTARALSRVHRWSGRLAVTLIGFVAYLCITGTLPEGFTWHRLFGFALVAVLLVKITILRGVPRASALLPILGMGAAGLLVAQWFTKALDVL